MCEYLKRDKQKIHCFKERAGWNDIHHITNSSRGGDKIASNTIVMDAYRHDAWHLLFKNKTLNEILKTIRGFRNYNELMRSINNYYKHNAFKLLFGSKTIGEVLALLEKVRRIKKTQSVSIKLVA